MPTYSANWTTGQSLHGSSTVSNNGNASDPVDLDGLGFYKIDVQVDLTISSGSPNGDVLVEVFGSVDGGSNTDTEALTTRRVTFTGTGTKRITIPGICVPHATVKVSNTTGADVTYVGRYAGMKQESA